MNFRDIMSAAVGTQSGRSCRPNTGLRRSATAALAGLAALAAVPSIAHAEYPDKVIEIVVPFAPGGGTDTIARILADEMSKELGESVIIDNRPGAGTMIGSNIVANSDPDGYKLLMASFAHAVNPSLIPDMQYDTAKDFVPVALVAKSYNILVINNDLPFTTVQELIDYAKAHPGELNYGSFGNGTSAHLSAELFKYLAGVDITHITYKGAAPAITDLLGGQIQMIFTSVASVSGQITSGAVRPLAVTSAVRSGAFPDLPTMAEAGVEGYVADAWYGLYAPAGTPPEVIETLNKAVGTAIQSEPFKKLEKVEGLIFIPGSPQELKTFVSAESGRWADLIKAQDIHVE